MAIREREIAEDDGGPRLFGFSRRSIEAGVVQIKTPELPAAFWCFHSTTISKLVYSLVVRKTLIGGP